MVIAGSFESAFFASKSNAKQRDWPIWLSLFSITGFSVIGWLLVFFEQLFDQQIQLII